MENFFLQAYARQVLKEVIFRLPIIQMGKTVTNTGVRNELQLMYKIVLLCIINYITIRLKEEFMACFNIRQILLKKNKKVKKNILHPCVVQVTYYGNKCHIRLESKKFKKSRARCSHKQL